ncbi:MAG: hypothetical protein E8D45_08845 [Nitrospira sp.]|nr:MAG: hypothetical protein E8D45_08845 [Nitrospira sp.]
MTHPVLAFATVLLLLPVLLIGCATALKRDGRCLASLTPEYLEATESLTRLEADWHRAVDARDRHLGLRPTHEWPALGKSLSSDQPDASVRTPSATTGPEQDEALAAYQRLREARERHQPTLTWYDRVYRRLSTRIEEDQILTEAGLMLLTSPAIVFYPIVRWNLRSVLWDGGDPDADSDPVTRYCAERLVSDQESLLREGERRP